MPASPERGNSESVRSDDTLSPPAKKPLRLIAIGLAVTACLTVGAVVFAKSTDVTSQKPNYKTILPEGRSIKELGGWKRVSPPNNDPVFAYADTLNNIPISVSEQPLPRSFKSDTSNKVAELAQKFNATDKTEANGTTIYIGTSSKGPQSVIFTKNDVLILIKSEKKISNTSWASYASSLQ